jgi:hypothetical protein
VIDDDGDMRVCSDIADALQIQRRAFFRFGVERREEVAAVEREADRNDVRPAATIGGCEMGDARRAQKPSGARREAREKIFLPPHKFRFIF